MNKKAESTPKKEEKQYTTSQIIGLFKLSPIMGMVVEKKFSNMSHTESEWCKIFKDNRIID